MAEGGKPPPSEERLFHQLTRYPTLVVCVPPNTQKGSMTEIAAVQKQENRIAHNQQRVARVVTALYALGDRRVVLFADDDDTRVSGVAASEAALCRHVQ